MVEQVSAADVPGWVADRLGRLVGPRWVGVDGFGASGKTTLAWSIAAELPASVVVSVDDFGRPGVQRWEQARFVAQVLEPLRAGREGRYQQWDWDLDAGGAWRVVPAGSVVIVEGVSATDEAVPVPWDVTVWVEVPVEVRRARARARDGELRWRTWLDDWIPSEEAYAKEQRPWERVDAIVVDGQR